MGLHHHTRPDKAFTFCAVQRLGVFAKSHGSPIVSKLPEEGLPRSIAKNGAVERWGTHLLNRKTGQIGDTNFREYVYGQHSIQPRAAPAGRFQSRVNFSRQIRQLSFRSIQFLNQRGAPTIQRRGLACALSGSAAEDGASSMKSLSLLEVEGDG